MLAAAAKSRVKVRVAQFSRRSISADPGAQATRRASNERSRTRARVFLEIAVLVLLRDAGANNTVGGNEQLGRPKATCVGLRQRARRGRRESRSCLRSPASLSSRRESLTPEGG
jgi:hypothetical protein